MARQPGKRAPTADRILNAALDLAERKRWRDITMEMIAAEAGATLAQVHGHFPTRAAFLRAFIDRTSKKVLAGHDPGDAGEPVRERLLDVLLRRLDALAPRKAAVRSILRDTGCDPVSLFCTAPSFAAAMAWSLEAAGVGASGPLGLLRIKGLGLIYLSAVRVWLRDESEDMSPTTAHIDRSLRRAETLMGLLSPRFPRFSRGGSPVDDNRA